MGDEVTFTFADLDGFTAMTQAHGTSLPQIL